MAFKENIFVHEKNISLSENKKDIKKIINNNDNIKNTDYINHNKKAKGSKSKIHQKFRRPKSAVYRHSKQNNNLIINNLHLNDFSLISQKKISLDQKQIKLMIIIMIYLMLIIVKENCLVYKIKKEIITKKKKKK